MGIFRVEQSTAEVEFLLELFPIYILVNEPHTRHLPSGFFPKQKISSRALERIKWKKYWWQLGRENKPLTVPDERARLAVEIRACRRFALVEDAVERRMRVME